MGIDLEESVTGKAAAEEREFVDLETVMREVKRKLQARNHEFDERLFAIFGRRESQIFVFNTPASRIIEHPETSTKGTYEEFLLVTQGGFKLLQVGPFDAKEEFIRVDSKHVRRKLGEFIENREEGNILGDEDVENEIGYRQYPPKGIEVIRLGDTRLGSLNVSSDTHANDAIYFMETGGPGGAEHGARLIQNPDTDVVTQIVKLNLERAEQKSRFEQQEIEEAVRPHLKTAQQVAKILS